MSSSSPKNGRLIAVLAGLALVLVGLWLALLLSPVGASLRAELARWVAGETAVGGPFALVDHNGKPVTDKDLAGKPFGLFFGFANCPDICPTTLADIGTWLAALGPDAEKIRFAMVTVDPERDSQAVLQSYMSVFDPRILALTGSRPAIDEVVRNYRVYARKVVQDGTYTMDHSAAIYLMDAQGRYWSVISRGESTEGVVAKLRKLIHGG